MNNEKKSSKLRKFTYPKMYRGQQIFQICWAKSDKEASLILDTTVHNIKTYCTKIDTGEVFDGIMAYFDSGMLWEKEKSLIGELMPMETMKQLIDLHMNDKAKQTKSYITQVMNDNADNDTSENITLLEIGKTYRSRNGRLIEIVKGNPPFILGNPPLFKRERNGWNGIYWGNSIDNKEPKLEMERYTFDGKWWSYISEFSAIGYQELSDEQKDLIEQV